MKRKIIRTAIAALACFSLTACGAKETKGASENDSVLETAQAASDEQESVTLKIMGMTLGGSTNEDVGLVTEAINEYVKPKINAEIEWEIINYGSYDQQLNLVLAGSEQVDIVLPDENLQAYAAQGALLPLDELLEQYGQGIVDVMGMDILRSCSYNGQIYAVPTNHDLARGYTYYYRKDMNEQYGLGLENAKTLDDLEEAFAKLKEQDPSKTAVFKNSTSALITNDFPDWDALGGNTFGVLMDRGQGDLTVENLYETEHYKELVERMHRWYQEGYIFREATTSSTSEKDALNTGNFLGMFANNKPGSDTRYKMNIGLDLGMVHVVEPYATTETVTLVTMAIPRNTADPERAMQFLNLMYTDPVVANYFAYGIEGEHYVFVDEENGIIDFPEGVDASNKKIDQLGWMYGNQLLTWVWNGDPADQWERMEEFNDSALRSRALGFVFDVTDVQNELTYCNNVVEKYAKGLECGELDPEKVLPAFISELKDAGIDRIIAEKQAQLDAWAQENQAE